MIRKCVGSARTKDSDPIILSSPTRPAAVYKPPVGMIVLVQDETLMMLYLQFSTEAFLCKEKFPAVK